MDPDVCVSNRNRLADFGRRACASEHSDEPVLKGFRRDRCGWHQNFVVAWLAGGYCPLSRHLQRVRHMVVGVRVHGRPVVVLGMTVPGVVVNVRAREPCSDQCSRKESRERRKPPHVTESTRLPRRRQTAESSAWRTAVLCRPAGAHDEQK